MRACAKFCRLIGALTGRQRSEPSGYRSAAENWLFASRCQQAECAAKAALQDRLNRWPAALVAFQRMVGFMSGDIAAAADRHQRKSGSLDDARSARPSLLFVVQVSP